MKTTKVEFGSFWVPAVGGVLYAYDYFGYKMKVGGQMVFIPADDNGEIEQKTEVFVGVPIYKREYDAIKTAKLWRSRYLLDELKKEKKEVKRLQKEIKEKGNDELSNLLTVIVVEALGEKD